MPSVEISPETFARLQQLAEPLVDTIDTVVARLLDERFQASPPDPNLDNPRPVKIFDPLQPPLLTHTKVLGASVANQNLESPSWSRLLIEVLTLAGQRCGNYTELSNFLLANTFPGRKEDEGYRYYPTIGPGISIQGQDANGAWRSAVYAARALQVPIRADFMWRMREGVAQAGQFGLLLYDPQVTRP